MKIDRLPPLLLSALLFAGGGAQTAFAYRGPPPGCTEQAQIDPDKTPPCPDVVQQFSRPDL